ncbi:MAG: ThuA domain-containing protein [Limisphaerales bacterium]
MKSRVLVICGDIWHPAEIIRRGLAPVENFGFAFTFLAENEKWPAKKPGDFSVIVLARANLISATDEREWLTADLELAFENHLRAGKGLLVIHAGTSRYEKSATMNSLIGGALVSHPEPCAVTIEPKPSHALTADVKTFTVRDEHYFMAMKDANAEIFLRSHSKHGAQPAGWTRAEGKGRVCVLTPGHTLEVWLHPEFQKLLLNALRWTAKLN